MCPQYFQNCSIYMVVMNKMNRKMYLKVKNYFQEFQVKQDLISPLFHIQL